MNISKRSEAANQPFCTELNKTQFIVRHIEPPILVEQIQTVLDKQNEIFEIRIFSPPLDFFKLLSNLFLYS